MKNAIFSVFIFLISNLVMANTNVVFSHKKAIIIIQGPEGDTEATTLFRILKTAVIDNGTTLGKEITFIDREGIDAVSISCRISKNVENYGSCYITIKEAHYSSLMPSGHYAAYNAFDIEEAERLSDLFILPQDEKVLFTSKDNYFTIFYQKSDLGDFTILFDGDHR
jgi:hypothetical protein